MKLYYVCMYDKKDPERKFAISCNYYKTKDGAKNEMAEAKTMEEFKGYSFCISEMERQE